MIQINLLPHREAKRAADLRESVAVLTLGLVMIGGVVVFVNGNVEDEIVSARATVQQLEGDIARYKPQEAQVEGFKQKKSQLEDKLDVSKGLDRARSGPVRIMDELAMHTPDRLWLTSMTTKAGTIQLEGNSLDNGVVADFLRGLSTSKYFANVDLVKTGGGDAVDGVRLVKFVISADLVTPSTENSDETAPAGA